MKINARFASICPKCNNAIKVGDLIDWERGYKSTHVTCPPKIEVRRIEPARPPVTEPGMYKLGDDIYKVQKSKQSGNLYAKKLVQIGGSRLVETGEKVHFEFEYSQGAIFLLSSEDRMSLDEAKGFGIRYGVCCVCGATLTDEKSVRDGIGPVCGGRV